MSKYSPLHQFLAEIPLTEQGCTLTFAQIEQIIAADLPPSARKYPAWWANVSGGSHVQAYAWLNSGWQVTNLNIPQRLVTFNRL